MRLPIKDKLEMYEEQHYRRKNIVTYMQKTQL